jgi:hypothetical protein
MTYILLSIAVVFILFQSFVYMSTNKTKEQPYTVLEKDGEIEIRLYPSATLATVQSKASSYWPDIFLVEMKTRRRLQ